MKLLPQDFDGSVFPSINDYVRGKIKGYALEHRTTTTEEHAKAVLDMIHAVYNDDLEIAGPARHPIWEKGWAENLDKFDPAKAVINTIDNAIATKISTKTNPLYIDNERQ